MIVEGLLNIALWFIETLFQGLQVVTIPTDLLSTALEFMRFGAWVVGADLLAIVFSSITFWLMFKFTAGLLLFIWRLIPLT